MEEKRGRSSVEEENQISGHPKIQIETDLDKEFSTSDLVAVFQAGEYEDTVTGNSSWAEGDWNGDGDFTTGDLVFAFQGGNYEQGPAMQVPEPQTVAMAMLFLLLSTSTFRHVLSKKVA